MRRCTSILSSIVRFWMQSVWSLSWRTSLEFSWWVLVQGKQSKSKIQSKWKDSCNRWKSHRKHLRSRAKSDDEITILEWFWNVLPCPLAIPWQNPPPQQKQNRDISGPKHTLQGLWNPDAGSTPGADPASAPLLGVNSGSAPSIQGTPLEQVQDLSLEQVYDSPLDQLQDPPMVLLLSPFSGQIDLQSAEWFGVKVCWCIYDSMCYLICVDYLAFGWIQLNQMEKVFSRFWWQITWAVCGSHSETANTILSGTCLWWEQCNITVLMLKKTSVFWQSSCGLIVRFPFGWHQHWWFGSLCCQKLYILCKMAWDNGF